MHQLNSQIHHKDMGDTDVLQMLFEKVGQTHATKDSTKVSRPKQTKSAECYTRTPEAMSKASRPTNELQTTHDVSEMRCVGSQTEKSLHLHRAPTSSELPCAYTQTEEEDGELVDSVSPLPSSGEAGLGDGALFAGSFPIPTDPARLAERILRNRTQLSAAFDDTEYEPYGLPEVVMKGKLCKKTKRKTSGVGLFFLQTHNWYKKHLTYNLGPECHLETWSIYVKMTVFNLNEFLSDWLGIINSVHGYSL